MTDNPEALIKIWNERHNLNLTAADAKAAFEDAQSSHAINTPRTYDGDVTALAPMLPGVIEYVKWDGVIVAYEKNHRFDESDELEEEYEVFKAYTGLEITPPVSGDSGYRRIHGGKVAPV